MAGFLLLAAILVPLFFIYQYYKSKESHTLQHKSATPSISLFHTRNLPKSYSLISFARLCDEDRLPYMSKMVAATPSSTVSFNFPLGGGCYIFTANPQNVRHVLKTQFSAYEKGHTFMSSYGELFGHGLFNVDGDEWRIQRQLASHEFTTGAMRNSIETVLEPGISNSLIPTLSIFASKRGQVVDLEELFQCFAFDNICKVAFGYDPMCSSPVQSLEGLEFKKAYQQCMCMSDQRSKTVVPGVKPWQVERYFNVGSQKRLMEAISKIRGFSLSILKQKKEKVKLGLEVSSGELLSRLIKHYGDDENMIIDYMINVILAGHDTLSSALTWFFWVVATNPKVENEILREIRSCNREGSSMCDQVKDMVYTHAAMCESMRLYPPVPEDMRVATKDDVLPDGTQVKKGVKVVYSIYFMGRSERIWGKDWAEYKPERWLEREDTSKAWRFVPRDSYSYPVFNAGPRNCPGKEFGFLKMKILVARFLKAFKVVPCNTALPVYSFDMTGKIKGGFPVCVEEREPACI